MSPRRILHFLTFMFLLFPALGHGALIHVEQDGTGDFTTLTAAVAAASAYDSIAVGPGTYSEGAMIEIDIPLVLFSTAGAENTILDGQATHRLLGLRTAIVRISGFSFVNGYGDVICSCGGAGIVYQGAHAIFEDCVFENNLADGGGAFYVSDSSSGLGTTLTVRDCRFVNNEATTQGGAILVVLGGAANIERCTFTGNHADLTAGAIDAARSMVDIRECLFDRNTSNDVAGALVFYRSSGVIRGNTFVDHTSLGPISGTVLIQNSPETNFTRNIVVGENVSVGLRYFEGGGLHSCNVFWNNAAGAIGGATLGVDEVEGDPLFCDAEAGDFSIAYLSPAAPENSACGHLIGAFLPACDREPPGAPTILSILDVPDDEGRQVRIKWERSEYDALRQPFSIIGYGIYRREPGVQKAISGALLLKWPRTPEIEIEGWDFVSMVPARGDDIYQAIVPTLCDAKRNRDICWSAFFVSAMTTDPLTFFDSPPDSGYSTDDIPPDPPKRLAVSGSGSGRVLEWEPPDQVIEGFRVYRGNVADFGISELTLVHTTQSNQWLDENAPALESYYKVTSVDEAGNESAPLSARGPVASPATRFALYQNDPNPFNPITRISYDVPEGGAYVKLVIFDVRGRLVRTLVDGFESGGQNKAIFWNGLTTDGNRARSGIYFYRLHAPGFERTFKMTLLE